MHRIIAALALTFAVVPASAEVINAAFTGIVSFADGTTANSGLTDGQRVTGAMQYVTNLGPRGRVTYDQLARFQAPTAAPQYSGITPDLSEVLYKTGNYSAPEPLLNTNFVLYLTSSVIQPGGFFPAFPTGSTLGSILLTQLGNLDLSGDTFTSTASYSSQNASGTKSTRVVVQLTDVTASVPEPTPFGLLGIAGLALAGTRRRRA